MVVSLGVPIYRVFTVCIWGWSGGAMVLGKLPVRGRPIYLK